MADAEVHRRVLGNGLRVVAVEMPHLHSAEIAVYVGAGARDDPPGKAGLSHFVEHMMFKGCRDLPSVQEIEEAFERLGGSVNAATDAETTCYYSRIHPSRVPEGISLLASMLLHPLLLGIDTERRIVVEEALEDLNEKGEEVNPDNLSGKLFWGDHPLGNPTVGFLDSIASFTVADVESHLRRYYVPTNTVICVAGSIDAGAVIAAAEATFGGWPAGLPPAPVPFAGPFGPAQDLFVRNPDSQVVLQAVFPSFPLGDEQMMSLRFIRRILCGGGSARLHLELRERLGVVYSVDAAISAFRETGIFTIEFSTSPENVPAALAETVAQVARLAAERVPADELERIRTAYLFELDYSRDSTYEMHVRYGWGDLMKVARSLEAEREEVRRVTAADIAVTAAALFAPQGLHVVGVGPIASRLRTKIESVSGRFRSGVSVSR